MFWKTISWDVEKHKKKNSNLDEAKTYFISSKFYEAKGKQKLMAEYHSNSTVTKVNMLMSLAPSNVCIFVVFHSLRQNVHR